MKTFFYLTAWLLSLTAVAQTPMQMREISSADAFRYADENPFGTARFRAMGGAFGALGGDLSALSVNPAGAAVFATGQMGATLHYTNRKNKSTFLGNGTDTDKDALDFSQLGGVFVYHNEDQDSRWKKFAIAANYEMTANFDDSRYFSGMNTNSVGDYFMGYANQNGGVPLELLQLQSGETLFDLYGYLGAVYGFGAQQAFLGYQGFVVNPLNENDPTNTTYFSNVPDGGHYRQGFQMQTRGYNSKFTINFATQFTDRYYFGLNLNTHFSDYSQWTSLSESNTNTPDAGLQAVRFINELRTYGNGFSAQLGGIAKITPELRVGAAYETPTWTRFQDRLLQRLHFVQSDQSGVWPTEFVDPGLVNEYETYTVRTPGKWTASVAYIFGSSGLLSLDYSYKDYGNMKFTTDYDWAADRSMAQSANRDISQQYSAVSSLRLGGEYRLQNWSLRAGFQWQQNPWEDGTLDDTLGYAAGLGYQWGDSRIDLAYHLTSQEYRQSLPFSGLADAAVTSVRNHQVALTFSVNLQ